MGTCQDKMPFGTICVHQFLNVCEKRREALNLVYHRRDLLRLGNRAGGGARVEIWIPEEPTDEASDL